MTTLLSSLLLAAAALALCGGVYALWRSIRAALGAERPVEELRVEELDARRASLLEEKNALLRTLEELAFDRDVGKLSEPDYASLEAKTRARAKDVLRELDAELGTFRADAEKLVRERLAALAHEPGSGAAAPANDVPSNGDAGA
ncbi:MAG: hypothetical protein R3A78_03970 [Polyangiales bacterium]